MDAVNRERRRAKTALFLTIAVLANSFGNLLLSIAMSRLPAFGDVTLWQYILGMVHDPFLIPGAALTATYALLQVWLFSWADLSFVVPCIASSYVISTLLAEFILRERIEATRWAGVLLICFGVFLVARTPVATKPHHGAAPE
jgi:drug/metabolite transporter (DMT)-like permease